METNLNKLLKLYSYDYRAKKDEMIIKLNKNNFNTKSLKNIVEYLEATSESKAKQEDIDELARQINKKWWDENKDNFMK